MSTRREFITLLGGAAAAWPLAARAQPAKLPTVGLLVPGTPASFGQRAATCTQRLRELGWIEGRTVAIEYRWAEAQRFDEIVNEFVRLKVDVIITGGTPPVIAAQKATSNIPIVFVAAGDPVGTGLVASLARPGGNITGLSNQTGDLAGKRLGLLREVAPDLRRLAIMVRAENVSAASETREVQAAAETFGIQVVPLEIHSASDIVPALDALKTRADALYVTVDSLVLVHAVRINIIALGARVPTMHGARELVTMGGLMSYGADFPDLWRRGADYIDKILRGAKPADIPVEQPTKFELIVNLTTAKALGLTIPPTLLARADEVIE
jgi:putative tryptophan/tyrosine transport system substrate-binding protein